MTYVRMIHCTVTHPSLGLTVTKVIESSLPPTKQL
jgi:hypothetical protein